MLKAIGLTKRYEDGVLALDSLNLEVRPGECYALLGAKAGYNGFKGVEIFLDARNLTNTMYMSNVNVIGNATAGSPLYKPGNGASIFAGIQARF